MASNVIDMGDPEKQGVRNSLWEDRPPFHIFVMHGFEVDFVSPKDGAVEFMMEPRGIKRYANRYQNFSGKTGNLLKPGRIDASDQALMRLIGDIYEQGGVVGGRGHGPGGFANVKLGNNDYLVQGKRVAGSLNSTERSKTCARQGELLPVLVEDQLRGNGVLSQYKEVLADKHEVVFDQRVVSSMFLPSTVLVAEEVVRQLKGLNP